MCVLLLLYIYMDNSGNVYYIYSICSFMYVSHYEVISFTIYIHLCMYMYLSMHIYLFIYHIRFYNHLITSYLVQLYNIITTITTSSSNNSS